MFQLLPRILNRVFGIAQVKTNQVALLLRVYGSLRIQARGGGSSSSFSTLLSGSLSAWESSSRTSSTRFDFVSLCLVTQKNEERNCKVWKLIVGEAVPLKLRLEATNYVDNALLVLDIIFLAFSL